MEESSSSGSALEWRDFEEDSTAATDHASIAARRHRSSVVSTSRPGLEVIRRFMELPSLQISPSLGSLVEEFQEENPAVEIVNLFGIAYEVERILAYRRKGRTYEFLVRWKGWSSKWDTWQRESGIRRDATPMLRLHIASFLYEASEKKKAFEYLREYLSTSLLGSEAPDHLLLAKLTGTALEISDGCVMPPNLDVLQNMRESLNSRLASECERLCLEAFDGDWSLAVTFMQQRLRALNTNEMWRGRIQRKEPLARIRVENLIDSESPPLDFVYITDYDVAPDVTTVLPLRSCSCETSSCPGSDCCQNHGSHTGTGTAFRAHGTTQLLGPRFEGTTVFECNSACLCDMRCGNRVTQRGVRIPLTIFRTVNRGWRVKTAASVASGTFVAEYLGELITAQEAKSRDPANLLKLIPMHSQDAIYAIDANKKGNITRFFDRSAEPNLAITFVHHENHNLDAPRVAFFTKRDIAEGEMLSFM